MQLLQALEQLGTVGICELNATGVMHVIVNFIGCDYLHPFSTQYLEEQDC